jgi:hypothetical protein
VDAEVQPRNNRPDNHSVERGHDQQWHHRAAQVQDKDPQEDQANRDQVFRGSAPGSVHLGFILPALRKAVVKPKYEKSVI